MVQLIFSEGLRSKYTTKISSVCGFDSDDEYNGFVGEPLGVELRGVVGAETAFRVLNFFFSISFIPLLLESPKQNANYTNAFTTRIETCFMRPCVQCSIC